MKIIWAIGLVILGTLIGAMAPIFLKKGSSSFKIGLELIKNYNLIIGVFLYGISTIPFLIALKSGELSVLYPFVSLGYVWVCLLSAKIFGEKIGTKWYGILLIIVGITLIGLS